MAQFNYKAIAADGKAKKGTVDAADRDKAMDKLKAEGLSVTDLKDAGEGGFQISLFKKKVKNRDLSILCKQMVSILNDCIKPKSTAKNVTFSGKKLEKFFPESYTAADVEKIVFELLEEWKNRQEGAMKDVI